MSSIAGLAAPARIFVSSFSRCSTALCIWLSHWSITVVTSVMVSFPWSRKNSQRRRFYLGCRMGMKKAIGHLVEHVAALGPLNGLRVLWLKRVGKGREVVLKVPELAGPLIVRTGTSDLAIFDEVVIGSGYDFEIPVPPAIIVDARSEERRL